MLVEKDVFFERRNRQLPSQPHTPNQADDIDPSSEELLDLYLNLPPKHRTRRFADTARAAKMTGLTQRTIQLWIEFGDIRAVHIGRKYQIDLRSLKSFLRSRVEP